MNLLTVIYNLSAFASKNSVRNRLRSFFTLIGVMSGMFLFTSIETIQTCLHDATVSNASDNTLVVYRENRFCPSTSRLPEYYKNEIATIDGVKSVHPIQIVVNNCGTSLDVVVFRGIDQDFINNQKPKLHLLHGSFDEWTKRIDGALIGKNLAKRRNLNVGDKIKGKVVVLADYGAFVEIAAGVEGLIHVSEMSWSQHLRSAQDFLNVGDEVEAAILTLDREERKMSLGIKQLMPDPWDQIETKFAVGTKHSAKVRNFTNFGVFVELEEGVDGLVHISDLYWQKKIKHPSEFCKVGEPLDVVVLEIDRESRRISLGHKQLEENPWEVFQTTFTEGSSHQGTVIDLKDKSGIVALPYGLEAICPARHMRKEDGGNAKVEDTLDFLIIEFNKDARKIVVSHTATFEETEDKPRNKKSSASVQKVNDSAEKSTLGDLDALAELKEKMDKGGK